MKSCFFIGHADTGREIYDMLVSSVEKHIKDYGVKHFVVGHYGNFDSMSASAVSSLKSKYDGLTLTLLLPYHPIGQNSELLDPRFDDSLYPFESPVPPRFAIVKANQYAINKADYLICYVQHIGKSRNFLEYANRQSKKRSLFITNLADL